MLDQPQTSPLHSDGGGYIDAAHESPHGESILTIVWRFKWLLCAFAAIGMSVGYWMYKQKPTSYRATSQLLFKTDAPLTLDSSTGVIRGGMPSGTLMQSLIRSDEIVKNAAGSLKQKSIASINGMSDSALETMVRGGINFQPITDTQDSRDRMIAALNFDGRDPEVCVAAVTSISEAIQLHFIHERQTTLTQIQELIDVANQNLLKEQKSIETEYGQFRETSDLQWNIENESINPFRERQFQLQTLRLEQEQKLRELKSDYRLAKNTSQNYEDPILVAQIIGRLGGVVDYFDGSTNGSSQDRARCLPLILTLQKRSKSKNRCCH